MSHMTELRCSSMGSMLDADYFRMFSSRPENGFVRLKLPHDIATAKPCPRAFWPPQPQLAASVISAVRRGDSDFQYSLGTWPNRRRVCLTSNLPISKSVVRLNAIAPAWPKVFQSPCARATAAAGLEHLTGSPATTPPST